MKRVNFLQLFKNADLELLAYLIFFLNVKFVVKAVAIAFILLRTRNFKFGFSFKKSRLPLFYLLIILLEVFKYIFITREYSQNYTLVFLFGLLQWTFCLISIHYLKIRVEKNDINRTDDTIKAFFTLNFIISLFFLTILIVHPIWLTYWGHGADISFNNPSAGDTILGISFDTSIVNATISCLGLIYFLHKRNYVFSGMNIVTIVLCTSNLTFLLTTGILIVMIFTLREKKLRINTLICSLSLMLLYFLFSPKNRMYIRNYFVQMYVLNKNPNQKQILDTEYIRVKSGDSFILERRIVEVMPDSAYAINDKKLGRAMGNFISFKDLHRNAEGRLIIPDIVYDTKPGKLISFIQTFLYLKSSAKIFLFGAGVGNFSSKLAFRASGVNAIGSYPMKYRYASDEFKYNHLQTYLYYKNADASKHSVMNYPFSVYNQLPGEYGFLGILLFTLFYIGYFISKYRRLTYGRYLIFIVLAFLGMEYWFESFSMIVMFELLMLLNLKEAEEPQTNHVRVEQPA